MPRTKKPAHLAADPRNGARTVLAQVDDVDLTRPPQPEGLNEAGVRAWEGYWSDPVCRAATRADHDLIRDYAWATHRRAEYQQALNAEPLVAGSQGQLVVSPYAKLLTREDMLIKDARDRLGLSPLSRSKLGIAIGEARKSAREAAMGAQPPAAPAAASVIVTVDDDPRLG